MQIKTAVRYHFIIIRMAIIRKQKPENNKCWQKYGEIGTVVHYWWECKMVQLVAENSIAVSEKIKQKTTTWSSNSTFWIYTPKN